jgi:hypothetical protein
LALLCSIFRDGRRQLAVAVEVDVAAPDGGGAVLPVGGVSAFLPSLAMEMDANARCRASSSAS